MQAIGDKIIIEKKKADSEKTTSSGLVIVGSSEELGSLGEATIISVGPKSGCDLPVGTKVMVRIGAGVNFDGPDKKEYHLITVEDLEMICE